MKPLYAILWLVLASFLISAAPKPATEEFLLKVRLTDPLIDQDCDALHEEDERWKDEGGECAFNETIRVAVGKSKVFTAGEYQVTLNKEGLFTIAYSHGDADIILDFEFKIPKNKDGIFFVPKEGYTFALTSSDSQNFTLQADVTITKAKVKQ